MGRSVTTRLVVAAVLAFGSCSADDGDTRSWCALVADPLPAFDAPDAVARWRALEDRAPADVRVDVTALRVVAEQVAAVDDADLGEVAALVMRPIVLERLGSVADARRRCG